MGAADLQLKKRLFSNLLCRMPRYRCECQHNTCGETCDRCCSGYNQRRWRPAVGKQSNECEGEPWSRDPGTKGPTPDPLPHFCLRTECVRAQSLQSYLTLYDFMDCSPPGFSVHGISQARILEWVAMPSSRGSSQPRDQTHISYVSCIGRRVLYQQCHLGSLPKDWGQCFSCAHDQGSIVSVLGVQTVHPSK